MRSFLLKPIEDERASPLSHIPSIGQDDTELMAHTAEEEGLAEAQEPWKDQKIIRSLRQTER
jgi:hypothetical protein